MYLYNIGVRGLPERDILSLGAMGRGGGGLRKFFRRRRRRRRRPGGMRQEGFEILVNYTCALLRRSCAILHPTRSSMDLL